MTNYTMKAELPSPRGTLIHGTMRPQDLIPAFLKFLESYPERLQDVRKNNEDLFLMDNSLSRGGFAPSIFLDDDDDWWHEERANFLLEELFDALNDCASSGLYFGAHPGDGSDYGFWPVEEVLGHQEK